MRVPFPAGASGACYQLKLQFEHMLFGGHSCQELVFWTSPTWLVSLKLTTRFPYFSGYSPSSTSFEQVVDDDRVSFPQPAAYTSIQRMVSNFNVQRLLVSCKNICGTCTDTSSKGIDERQQG
jgi:hypothetical protein